MSMTLPTIVIAAILFTASAVPATAQDPDPTRPDMGPMMQQMMEDPLHRSAMMTHALPAMREHLGLSDEQVQSLEQIQTEAMSEARRHVEMTTDPQGQLAATLTAEQPDEREIDELTREIATHRAQAQAALIRGHIRMREALSDDQRIMLDQMDPEQVHSHMMQSAPMHEMMMSMQESGAIDCPMHPVMMDEGHMDTPRHHDH